MLAFVLTSRRAIRLHKSAIKSNFFVILLFKFVYGKKDVVRTTPPPPLSLSLSNWKSYIKGFYNFLTATILNFILNWPIILFKLKKCNGWYQIHSSKFHANTLYTEAISPHYITIFNEINVIHPSLNIPFLSHSRREKPKLICRLYALDIIQTMSWLFPL